MLNEVQNISTGVPIQLHDGHVHHEAPCCSLFWPIRSLQLKIDDGTKTPSLTYKQNKCGAQQFRINNLPTYKKGTTVEILDHASDSVITPSPRFAPPFSLFQMSSFRCRNNKLMHTILVNIGADQECETKPRTYRQVCPFNFMMVMYIMRHRAVPFLVYISMPEMFQMDSFFRFEKKGTFFNMEHIGF